MSYDDDLEKLHREREQLRLELAQRALASLEEHLTEAGVPEASFHAAALAHVAIGLAARWGGEEAAGHLRRTAERIEGLPTADFLGWVTAPVRGTA